LTQECVNYTYTAAEALLNGSHPLFNDEYLGEFLELVQANDFTSIAALWNVDATKAVCFAYYIQTVIIPDAVIPQLNATYQAGGGLVVTRTVNEWLFTAQDPLLTLLGQPNGTSFVGNTTVTPAEAATRNYTYYRIYTGSNDLYWSLMPYNDGVELPFWRNNVSITGYNGSQFLVNGAIDDENPGGHPLLLWNDLINRSIPFQNIGSDTWDGVTVRYLTLTDDALASETANPVNADYYATYTGLVNKTSNPPYIPLYLSLPDFHTVELAVTQNVTIIDNIFIDYDPSVKLSRHRLSLFLLVEPTLGTTVWGNLPVQVNLQYGPTATFYPKVMPGFAPIYWNAIGNQATSGDLNAIKTGLYANEVLWKVLIGVGAGVGASMVIGGSVAFHHYRKHLNELKDLRSSDSASSFSSPKQTSVASFNPTSTDDL